MKGFRDRIGELVEKLGLPASFPFDILLDEDRNDWSFVLKLHALLEAACAHAIVRELNRPVLEDLVARLPMGSGSGKVAFAAALELLSKEDTKFLGALGDLRNALVHRIGNAKIVLADVFLKPNEHPRFEDMRNKFRATIVPYLPKVTLIGGTQVDSDHVLTNTPAVAISWRANQILNALAGPLEEA